MDPLDLGDEFQVGGVGEVGGGRIELENWIDGLGQVARHTVQVAIEPAVQQDPLFRAKRVVVVDQMTRAPSVVRNEVGRLEDIVENGVGDQNNIFHDVCTTATDETQIYTDGARGKE